MTCAPGNGFDQIKVYRMYQIVIQYKAVVETFNPCDRECIILYKPLL